MKCFYHPEKDAIAICKNCQKGVCDECGLKVKNGIACKNSEDHCEVEVARLDNFLEKYKIASERTSTNFSRTIMFHGALAAVFILGGLIPILWTGGQSWGGLFPLLIGLIFLMLTFFNYSEKKKYELANNLQNKVNQ